MNLDVLMDDAYSSPGSVIMKMTVETAQMKWTATTHHVLLENSHALIIGVSLWHRYRLHAHHVTLRKLITVMFFHVYS